MAFCKTTAVQTDNERHMEKQWFLQSKRTVKQQLLRSGRKEVVAANDLCDAHCGIIDNRRNRIPCTMFVTGKGEIAECGRNIH